ncbi:MAG TPA: ankyrin repeat domain-containing protein [Thermoanaerobaculia bacterium]|nr:ankyrin repeat domain-containing protein [Thermoanaerobaculia bacterium]
MERTTGTARTVTRGEFLRFLSLAAGVGTAVSRISLPGAAEAAAAKPATPATPVAGLLDSQRFRQAVVAGDAAAVRRYLEADPALAYSKDERGRSVFLLACLAGKSEIAEAIRPLRDGLDLVEAVFGGRPEDAQRVAELVEKVPRLINDLHPWGGTAVHATVRRGRTDLLFATLRSGPDFDLPSAAPESLTACRMAVEHPDPAVAEELVDALAGNGGDPNAKQGDGWTVLHAAARAGNPEVIRLLLFDGADPEARMPDGQSALDVAVRLGHAEAAALLRKAKSLPRKHRTSRFLYTADGGHYEPKPQPPLPWPVINEYVAVAHGNLARMRELLALYPTVVHACASWDELAVEAGAHVGFKDGVHLVLDQGAPCALPTAAMLGMTAHVKKLLAEDPQRIWDCGAHNMPPMWFPAIGGGTPDNLEIAKLLLDAGADPNAHKRGQTALHWAARGGQMDMVDLLLGRGADPNAKAKTPQGDVTPLAMAVKAEKKDVAERLRKGGAA